MGIGVQQSIDASIQLNNQQLSYRPGDLVSGTVERIQLDRPEELSVALKLVGRLKTKVHESSTDSDGKSNTTWYHGEAPLLNVQIPIYQGIVQPGKSSWPFAITIPQSQLPLPPGATPESRLLPPSHYTKGDSLHLQTRDKLYVKYVLEAYVQSRDDKTGRSGLAVYPLYIRPSSSNQPITDQRLRRQAVDEKVRSLHLLPELAETKLSFRQHMRTLFKPGEIPSYEYTISVLHPTVIQLESTNAIQFKVSAASKTPAPAPPPMDKEKKEHQQHQQHQQPPRIDLIAANIGISSATHTNDLDANTYKLRGPSNAHWHEHGKLRLSADTPDSKHQAWRPLPTDTPSSPLDIGALAHFSLSTRGIISSGARILGFDKPLYPSFYSHHVALEHQLWWKLTVSCAGKKRVVRGEAPVTVLGPSEEREAQILRGLGPHGVGEVLRMWAEGEVDTPVLAIDAP